MYRKVLFIAAAALISIAIFVTVFNMVKRRFVRPQATHPGKAYVYEGREDLPAVALVLDDFGYTKRNLNGVRELGIPLTLAVLPNTPYSAAVCSFAEANGMEVILHMPMEPESDAVALEKDTLSSEMEPEEVTGIIEKAFKSVPSARGMNNHMGSKATRDSSFMRVVLSDLKDRDMFFLDSRTCRGGVSEDIALQLELPYLKRDVFIDNELEREKIKKQLARIEKMALGGSNVVAIGHDRTMTIEVLDEVVPQMRKNGIRFVTLSEMMEENAGSGH
ncbi:MAG: hypothetical protein GF409_02860 [Candidatus Omnitrophica bacterium]|nr:hypothetical protein [Candidatus Omnitrophota bacterium]